MVTAVPVLNTLPMFPRNNYRGPDRELLDVLKWIIKWQGLMAVKPVRIVWFICHNGLWQYSMKSVFTESVMMVLRLLWNELLLRQFCQWSLGDVEGCKFDTNQILPIFINNILICHKDPINS